MTQSSTPKTFRRRWTWIVILFLLVVSVGWTVRELYLHRPMGHGPAGPTIDADRFRKIGSDRRTLFLALGDSITAGFGAPPGRGYFDLLVQGHADDATDVQNVSLSRLFPKHEAVNIAVSGTNSLQHHDQQLPTIESQPVDVFGFVFVTTGGNDLIHWYGRHPPREGAMYGASLAQAEPWIERFSQRLDSLIAVLTSKFPGGCEIYLGNIYDPTDGVGSAWPVQLPEWPDGLTILSRYNAVIDNVAKRHENVHVVDLHAAFLGHGLYCRVPWNPHYGSSDPHHWFDTILEDPNPRGHDAIRRLFLLRFAECQENRSSAHVDSLPITH
ncbi:MAG: SGNH/GDSL hydrolase family protein [Planctomycetota bacterium]